VRVVASRFVVQLVIVVARWATSDGAERDHLRAVVDPSGGR
jgi:hypothetical protein